LCGILLGVLYTYYYTSGDTFSFFHDGSTLVDLARADWREYFVFLWSGNESFPVWDQLIYSQHRSLFFTKAISIINLITYNNYWITSLYFSMISFLGSWYLTKRMIEFFPESRNASIIAFLFFPSVVFWSSGIIKESLAMPGLFFLTALFIKAWHYRKFTLVEWILFPVALVCVWKLKYFYLALFGPIVITTLVVKYFSAVVLKNSKFGNQLLIWFLFFGGCLFIVNFLHPNFHLGYLPEVILMNNQEYTRLSSPENIIHFNNLDSNFISILQHSPKALFSGLLRPYLWEANSTVKFLSATENLTLVVFIVSSFILWKPIQPQYRLLTFSVLIYSAVLCIFLALSTPNIGTLVRYRIGFLPFLVYIILYRDRLFQQITKSVQRLFFRLVRQ